tara:strand:+ start:184 stop:465 length:282 start_codon:yes stop_codon:yes gene_type:complete
LPQKNDIFELVETSTGELMLSIADQKLKTEAQKAEICIESQTLKLKNQENDIPLSPFPIALLQKIAQKPTLLVSEFSDTGLKKSYYVQIEIAG